MEEENKVLVEVLDEIESALKDPKGLVIHQRRLAFSLSLGSVELIENYLKKLSVLKSGSKINHLWLKKKKENVKRLMGNYLTTSVEEIDRLDKILDLAYKIEEERNLLAYGKPTTEKNLKEKIGIFLEIKKEVENE